MFQSISTNIKGKVETHLITLFNKNVDVDR